MILEVYRAESNSGHSGILHQKSRTCVRPGTPTGLIVARSHFVNIFTELSNPRSSAGNPRSSAGNPRSSAGNPREGRSPSSRPHAGPLPPREPTITRVADGSMAGRAVQREF